MSHEDDVSRETVTPPAPPEARGVFAVERLPLAERYAAWLADAGVVRGLIGPREVPRLWERHLMNCAALGAVLPEGASVADIGSGAGLPGLVLAIARPDLRLTLIEPLLRRTTFLEEVAADLGLDNVEVVRGRADLLHGKRTFDVVTSRAVAPLGRLLEWSMPLVDPVGTLVAMKGSSVADEIVAARDVLERFGCDEPEVLTLDDGLSTTSAVVVAWADPTQVAWRISPRSSDRGSSRSRTKKTQKTQKDRRRSR
jgi:16S rRNA (guanine527-N7)-methyltransferase